VTFTIFPSPITSVLWFFKATASTSPKSRPVASDYLLQPNYSQCFGFSKPLPPLLPVATPVGISHFLVCLSALVSQWHCLPIMDYPRQSTSLASFVLGSCSLRQGFWCEREHHPADPLCGVTGECLALCGRGSGANVNTTQLTLSAGSLVNALLSAAGVLVRT
jgi:hypothetical protein